MNEDLKKKIVEIETSLRSVCSEVQELRALYPKLEKFIQSDGSLHSSERKIWFFYGATTLFIFFFIIGTILTIYNGQ